MRLLVIILICVPNLLGAQLTVNDQVNAVDLANYLAGPGVSISNVTINCSKGAYGIFDATTSNVGINDGILLTTGLAADPSNKCVYNLSLDDTNFDQWDCGEVLIYINGVLSGTYTITPAQFGFLSANILLEDGDLLEVVYQTTGGAACDEGEHVITFNDPNFNQMFTANGPITPGLIYSTTINCTPGGGFTMLAGAPGPNSDQLASYEWNTVVNDPDLMAIDPDAVNDVCILEFDILPTCDTLKINYVFASEEYPNFVNSYNDVFGFFLSGPNPAGGTYNGLNIAQIPGTTTPVSINNVNNGNANTGPCMNCGYYVNNGSGDDCWAAPMPTHCTDSSIIRYNGFTVPLVAESPVIPCQTYHMKIAVADAVDWSYDSGVFLTHQGLNCPNGSTVQTLVSNDTIVEGCREAEFDVVRVGDTNVTFTVDIEYIGSATSGTDYPAQITSYTYPIGDTITSFVIPGTADALAEGAEDLTIVISYELCLGTITRDTIRITILDDPTLLFNDSPEDCGVCNGQSTVTMSPAGNPVTYAWGANSGNQTTQTASNLCSGTQLVTVTDSYGCVATDSTSISSIGGPQLSATSIDESCLGLQDGSIIVSTTTNGTLEWYLDGVLQTGTSFNTLSPGTYFIELIDPVLGCQSDTTITIAAGTCCLNATTISTNETCNGICDGSGDVTSVTDNIGTVTYQWYDAAGNPLGQTTNMATSLCSGNYTVEISDDVCTISEPVIITAPVSVTLAPFNDTTICQGGTATINPAPSNGTMPYTYNWSNGVTTSTSVVNPLNDSTISLFITDANGCISNTETINITLHGPLNVSVTNGSTICEGDNIDISASAAGGLGLPYNYSWSDEFGNNVGLTDNVNITPTEDTWYYVNVTDNCETPFVVDSVLILVESSPDIGFTTDSLLGCVPFEVTFTDTVNSGGTIEWNFGDGNSSTASTTSNIYNNSGCYDVTVTSTSLNGCVNTLFLPSYVCVEEIPTASFSYGPQPTNLLNTEISFTNNSVDGTHSYWTFDDINFSTDDNPVFIFPNVQPDNYEVCLISTNSIGCADTTCQIVEIGPYLTVYVPNAFTPNNDGKNDVFMPVIDGNDPTEFDFYVFNRWGEQIFASTSTLIGWDGTVNGLDAPDGVYIWKIETKEIGTNIDYLKRGHVTLIR